MSTPDKIAGGEVLVYEAADGSVRVEVRLEQDTVWLTQRQMSDLFETTPENGAGPMSLKRMGIDRDARANVGAFSEGQRRYLEFHRENASSREASTAAEELVNAKVATLPRDRARLSLFRVSRTEFNHSGTNSSGNLGPSPRNLLHRTSAGCRLRGFRKLATLPDSNRFNRLRRSLMLEVS